MIDMDLVEYIMQFQKSYYYYNLYLIVKSIEISIIMLENSLSKYLQISKTSHSRNF